MSCVTLIFKDEGGNEQMRACYVAASGPVKLLDGSVKPAADISIGDVVRLPDGSFRAVDEIEEV